jgi:hypothetical protein
VSITLRRKLVEEIEARAKKRLGTYDIGAIFDSGTTIINRDNFEAILINYINDRMNALPVSAAQAFSGLSRETEVWLKFANIVYKKMQNKSNTSKAWQLQKGSQPSGVTTSKLVFTYGRKKVGGKFTPTSTKSNLERRFNTALKETVKQVLSTEKFIDYSHGSSLPGSFNKKQSGQQEFDFAQNNKQFPGATGTKAQKDIENAIYKILKGGAENIAGQKRLYTSITRVVKAKYDDMFSSTMDLKTKTTKKSDGSTLTYEGELVFSEDGLNPGAPDKGVRTEMKRFLELGMKEFSDEVVKLIRIDILKAQDLWTNSPGPVDRLMIIQQGLIAEGLVTAMGKLDKRSKRVGKDGGLDMRLKVNKEFILKMNKIVGRATKNSSKLSKAKGMKVSKKTSIGATVALKKVKKRTKDTAKTAQSPLHLQAMLEALLPQVVASKMGTGGALRYQTGRFANSVEPTQVMVGPRGGVHVDYTYMKYPYQTFEPGFKQGSTARDPRKIIGESVREIAQSIIGSKFLKVRRV